MISLWFAYSGGIHRSCLGESSVRVHLRVHLYDGKKPVDGMEFPGVGKLKVSPTGVIIMPGAIITKENVDQFDF